MSNDNAGRTPRSTGGNAPMGSTVAIVVTAAAVILGFLILKRINDSGDSTTPAQSTSTTIDTSTTLNFADTTTTTEALTTTGTKVQVANAAGIGGVAGQLTTALSGVGFDMAEATNSTGAQLPTSKVVYDPNNAAALPVAQSVAKVLGGIAVEPAAGAPATTSGAFADGSGVIIFLGTDLAGKTLDQIAGIPSTGTTTPPAVTAVPTTAAPTTT